MVRVRRALEARNMLHRAVIFSFQPAHIQAVRMHCPTVPALLLIDPPKGTAAYPPGTIERAVASGATVLGLKGKAVTPELVARSHAREMPVFAYTVDDPAEIEAMVKAGVDGIISNKPRATQTRIALHQAASVQRNHSDKAESTEDH